jgi:hypothetical protein
MVAGCNRQVLGKLLVSKIYKPAIELFRGEFSKTVGGFLRPGLRARGVRGG